MTPIGERIHALLADLLVLRPDEIRPSSLLVDDLDADSISLLELWFMLEKEFDLELPEVKADEEMLSMPLLPGLERLESIGGDTTFFEFVKRQIGAQAETAPRVVAEAAHAVDRERRADIAARHTVASLAEIVGGRVPSGLQPETPIAELRLRELFRFLTVGALTDYVTFLLASRR